MDQEITLKTKVYDIVTRYPETVDTFLAHGFNLITNPVKLKTVARFVTLESACSMKKVNPELFLRELNRALAAKREAQDCCQFQIDEEQGDINIAALLPCPIAIPIKEAFKTFAEKFNHDTGLKIGLHVKAAALDLNSQPEISYADYDLFIAPGYDHFTGNHKNYRQTNLQKMNQPFTQAGMSDPNNRYSITGAAPAVLIRNRKKVSSSRLCWADLCNDNFQGKIATPLAELELQKGVIYQMFNDFGEDGLQRFARKICGEYHPAEMIKLINRRKLDHIDLFVAPLFFTKMLKNPDFEVIWPSDGAIAIPLILSIHQNAREETTKVSEYLTSADMANLLSAEGLYPTSHIATPNPIPNDTCLLWPGWERLYQVDFQQHYRKSLSLYQQYCKEMKTTTESIHSHSGESAMSDLSEKKEQFRTIDLRGESMEFLPKLLEVLDTIEAGDGLHLIKEFEPVPLYQLLKERGFIHQMEKVSDDEYHVYLQNPAVQTAAKASTMAQHIQVDAKRAEILAKIVIDFFNGANLEDLNKRSQEIFPVSAPEFAYVEQLISERGISDTQFEEQIENLIQLFKKSLDQGSDLSQFPAGHPIHTYLLENQMLKKLITALRLLIKNNDSQKASPIFWGDYIDNLSQTNNHYVRKENQLFPYLEQKGFDKPSTIMWTLHDNTRKFIKQANSACHDPSLNFAACSEQVSLAMDSIEDMIYKEEKILFPTAIAMLSEQEWIQARQGEIELDYCLIDEPPMWPTTIATGEQNQSSEQPDISGTLKLSEGLMSLEQINAIFSHLPVDISFVDSDNRVRFYNQCKERIFPRSPAVIGREVKYCHPPKSVDTVLEIIEAFRSGKQDVAEFWLTLEGKFIYIRYFAVRDANKTYQGVLEVMQEVSRIRELKGQQTLLNWASNQ